MELKKFVFDLQRFSLNVVVLLGDGSGDEQTLDLDEVTDDNNNTQLSHHENKANHLKILASRRI